MSTITQDLQSIKTVEDTLTSNKVARFAYTQQAYTDNDANGVTEYNPNQEQNIPVADASIMKVNSSILNLGWRAQASALTRMLMNHFLGRISYNLNKVNDNVSAILSALIAKIGQAEGIASLGVNGKVPDAQLGRALANGVASLDENGRIPYSQLPEDALELKGYWDASTNTPALVDGTGTSGDFYFVDVAGTQDLGSGEQYFAVGDRVLYDGSTWKNVSSGFIRKINNQAPDAQGNKEVTLGNMTLNITKGFLTGLFSPQYEGKNFVVESQIGSIEAGFIACIDNILYLTNIGGRTFYTEDGETWFNLYNTAGIAGAFGCLLKVNNLFIGIIRGFGYAYYSTDGKNWSVGLGANTMSEQSSSSAQPVIQYHDGIYVAGLRATEGKCLYWSEDGITWTLTNVSSGDVKSLAYANGLWICGNMSSTNGIRWSEDGKNWTLGATVPNPRYIDYFKGLWVCCAYHGNVYWSEDGKNWTANSSITSAESIYYTENLCVCCTSDAGVWWSEDGKNWTQGTGLGNIQTYHAKCINNIWFCRTNANGLWRSEDGKNWTICTGIGSNCSVAGCLTSYATTQLAVFISQGVMFCGCYDTNNIGIWKSIDTGKTWEKLNVTLTSGSPNTFNVISYKQTLFSLTNKNCLKDTTVKDVISSLDFGQAVPLID